MSEIIRSSSSGASTSAPTRPLCAICNHSYSIYTCPRCSFRTCSLPCSSAHKSRDACSGARDKVKYVPMNQYGWGTMMDDYVFLEDVGRKVGDWGAEIGRGRYMASAADRGRGRGFGGRGRGRGRSFGGGNIGKSKQDVFKQQLELRDIDVELLPDGMERKMFNKSMWDFKKKTALLTIEFKFHAPANPAAPSSQPREPTFALLTHKNRFETPLLTLIQSKVIERSSTKSDCPLPAWIISLVCPDSDNPDSFIPPQCLISTPTDLRLGLHSHSAFYKLDPTQKLSTLLRDAPFVEFPTIEVWEDGDTAFKGTIVDAQGGVTKSADGDGERRVKKPKLDVKAGKKAINGLLGGYGSDEEDGDREEGVMAILGDYAESDEDNGDEVEIGDGEADADGDDEVELALDPAALLELVRQAQALDAEAGDEDLVDWGDSDEERAI